MSGLFSFRINLASYNERIAKGGCKKRGKKSNPAIRVYIRCSVGHKVAETEMAETGFLFSLSFSHKFMPL